MPSPRSRSGIGRSPLSPPHTPALGTASGAGGAGFGTWPIGSAWGPVKDSDSLDALRVSLDEGVDFLYTADVYGDHTSERLIAGVLKERRKQGKSIPIVATKIGRRLPTQDAKLFTYANLAPFVEDSLKALEADTLDLVQLHCPPIETYYRPEAFDAMDRLQRCRPPRGGGAQLRSRLPRKHV